MPSLHEKQLRAVPLVAVAVQLLLRTLKKEKKEVLPIKFFVEI